MRFVSLVKTVFALGVPNILRVFFYRLGLKAGLNPVRKLNAEVTQGVFFKVEPVAQFTSESPKHNWQTQFSLFGYWPIEIGSTPPDWNANPMIGGRVSNPDRPWWKIPDFDPAVGDIKPIWELSRFDWVLAFAQQACSGKRGAVALLNFWLNDWCVKNKPFFGPNWKCGQESSIRVMHLAMAAVLLQEYHGPRPELIDLIKIHLMRIKPTLLYAIAQDNNHGTSEAAALFIGGSWLAKCGVKEGKHWGKVGRKWLEDRAERLIGDDGSFSQYSLNYHRVLIDTFSMVEVWRRALDLQEFSVSWYEKAGKAVEWMRAMINPVNGDGPNLGANDGARLLPFTDKGYRDFRPSVQLASVLFKNQRAYGADGAWNIPLRLLGVELPTSIAPELTSQQFDQGGYALLRIDSAVAIVRYPRFRFRPSHSDLLHVDFWLGARNVLRDAGTYSYNTDEKWMRYFPGTASHNTVQFDGRDQMPRLSRFLFGDWPKTNYLDPLQSTPEQVSFAVGYKDSQQAKHVRGLILGKKCLRVIDEISGFNEKAVLRWRLEPGNWVLKGHTLNLGVERITVKSTVDIVRFEIVEGWESRFYLQKELVPVLEIEVVQGAVLTTEYQF